MKRYIVLSILCIGMLLHAPHIMAKMVTTCDNGVCATLSVPDCITPNSDVELEVEGHIEGGGAFTSSAYGLYENADTSYTTQHILSVSSGSQIDVNGFYWGSHYTHTYTVTSSDTTSTYTFVFGSRGFGHDFYDVAVEATAEFCDSGTEIPFDIKPQSCPNPLHTERNGVLSAALVGTDDFDVTRVDPSTLQLAGVSPIRHAYEDVTEPYAPYTGKTSMTDCTEAGPDGTLDLTLKFKASEVIEALERLFGRALRDGEELVVPIAGDMTTMGSSILAIYGEDVIKIIRKK